MPEDDDLATRDELPINASQLTINKTPNANLGSINTSAHRSAVTTMPSAYLPASRLRFNPITVGGDKMKSFEVGGIEVEKSEVGDRKMEDSEMEGSEAEGNETEESDHFEDHH